MRIIYRVIRNHLKQGAPSLYLQIENEKYFFNVPETTQRFIKEFGLKFSRGSNFFFGGVTPNHIMGMVGLSLTLFQQGTSQGTKMFGPPELVQFFRDMRYMMGIKLCHYSIACLEKQYDPLRNIVGIMDEKYIFELVEKANALEVFSKWDLWANSSEAIQQKLFRADSHLKQSSEYFPDEIIGLGEHKVFVDANTEILYIPLEKSSPGDYRGSIFVILSKKAPGSFIQSKLNDYGIKGKMMKDLLTNGKITVKHKEKDVTLTVEELSEPASDGVGILLVDTPPGFYKPELILNNPILQKVFPELKIHDHSMMSEEKLPSQESTHKNYNLTDVIHSGDFDIITSQPYQAWLQKFSPTVRHVFAHESFDDLTKELIPKVPKKQAEVMKPKSRDSSPPRLSGPKDKTASVPSGNRLIDFDELGESYNSHRYQMYVNSLHKQFPQYFPEIKSVAEPPTQEQKESSKMFFGGLNAVEYVKGAEFICMPEKSRKVQIDKTVKEAAEIDKFYGFQEALAQAKANLLKEDNLPEKLMQFEDDPTAIFLGTGSMMPATYRNVSAISLTVGGNLPGGESNILMDCGEGTFAQLVDAVGGKPGGIQRYLERLRLIYITHIHPDHNLGLFKLLSERIDLQKKLGKKFKPIFVVMPRNTLPILLRFNKTVQDLDCLTISCQDLIDLNLGNPVQKTTNLFDKESLEAMGDDDEGDKFKALVSGFEEDTNEVLAYCQNLETKLELFKQFYQEAGLKMVQPVRVLHCPQSHGVVISSIFGWKVSYSGDCRPTPAFAEEGIHSTVMIHEATFQTSHEKQAKEKMHSTVQDAVKIAMKMKANRAVLTHFSQRYTVSESLAKKKKPIQDQFQESAEVRAYLDRYGVMALDHLTFKLSDLNTLPLLSPAINFGVSDDN